ncbi:hypothetical protein ACFXDJ_01045 [Streptomyces sp. NPDC059443]|uniref:hypothetical protein n=1 Tax=Streptomyces sp. NPDC059443 TaxID=3346831 RepID=UPI0036CAF75E
MRKASRSAALLALCCTAAAAALTGCGGPAREGYVAVGAAAAGPERGAGENVAPQGRVEFQPLPPATAGSSASSSSTSTGTPGSQPPGGSDNRPGSTPGATPPTTGSGTPGSSTGSGTGTGSTPGPGSGTPTKPGTGGSTSPAPPPAPATAAKLSIGAPTRSAAADRWCEQVTVAFTNTGGTAARSGTVSFATHIIGALGVDWATITSTQPLPAPIAANTTKTQTYTVCVESWRVPLGMHIETQRVTATWS